MSLSIAGRKSKTSGHTPGADPVKHIIGLAKNDVPARIRAGLTARSCGLTLTPKQFAQNVVERNFKDFAQKFAEPDS